MSTYIVNVDWNRVRARDTNMLVTRLAMVVNDISSALQFLEMIEEHKPHMRDEPYHGHYAYAYRMMQAHLNEGVDLLAEIVIAAHLRKYLNSLTFQAKSHLDMLRRILPGGTDRAEFTKHVLIFRNTFSSHYDKSAKLSGRGVESLAQRKASATNTVVLAATRPKSRFWVADIIMAEAIVTALWKVEINSDEEAERGINAALKWCGDRTLACYRVGSELCCQFFRECSTI